MQIFAKVPAEVLDKFYGCGATLPTGIDGLTVLDLGSGSGRDCYAAAALVGERGSVIGVDMTSEQLEVRDFRRVAFESPCRSLCCNSSLWQSWLRPRRCFGHHGWAAARLLSRA